MTVDRPGFDGAPELKHYSDRELTDQIQHLLVEAVVAGRDEIVSVDGKRFIHPTQLKDGVGLHIEHALEAEGTETDEVVIFVEGQAVGDFDVAITEELASPDDPDTTQRQVARMDAMAEMGLVDPPLERAQLEELYTDLVTGLARPPEAD